MNHAVTIGGILAVLSGLAGLVAAGIGLLMIFAGGMSDAPAEGDSTSSTGCIVCFVGGFLIALSIWLFA